MNYYIRFVCPHPGLASIVAFARAKLWTLSWCPGSFTFSIVTEDGKLIKSENKYGEIY